MICGSISAVAQGRTLPQADDAANSDIVVTATRRPLSGQAVPASIDVLPAERLKADSINRFEDLARVDTSLQLSAYQGETQLFLRGIGAVTFIGGFESSVAVNLDGVYLGRPTAVAPALFDVERVEILKGPQGSLYGRNATGGAINIVTRAPTDTWHSDASLTVGNYGRADVFSGISGPLAKGVSFRVAVGTNNHDGFTRLYLGRSEDGHAIIRHAEDQHDVTARARVDWDISPAVTLQVSGDYYRADDRAIVFHFAGPGYANNPLFAARLATGEVGGYGSRTINTSFLPYNQPENWGVSARFISDIQGATLTSTTAYRKTRPRNLDDMSNSTVLGESQFKSEDSDQFSQEFELRSAAASRLRYLLGASSFRERNTVRNEFFIPFLATYLGGSGSADCCLLRANGQVNTDAYAVFGEIGYPILPATILTVGGRFGHERRWGANFLDFAGLMTVNQARLAPVTFESFTPKFVLEHDLGGVGNAYASITKGYKSGGFNVGSAQNTPYSPEEVWSYEAGIKLRVTGHSTLNLAAFHYDYTNLQVQDVDKTTVLIRNAATAKVDGIEISTKFEISHRFRIEGAGTFLNARYSRYTTVNTKLPQLGVIDLSGNPLPQAPRWRGNADAEYDQPIGDWGTLHIRGGASWQDRTYFSAFKDPLATQAPYWWLKARATIIPARQHYRVALFADNLTNTRAFTNISLTGDLDGSRALGNLAPPRTWGAELSYTF